MEDYIEDFLEHEHLADEVADEVAVEVVLVMVEEKLLVLEKRMNVVVVEMYYDVLRYVSDPYVYRFLSGTRLAWS